MIQIRHAWLFTAAMLLVLGACSLEYDMLDDGDANGRPELELSRLQHTVVRSGRIQLQVHAEHSRTFQGERRQELIDVYFWEFDRDGAVASEGRADQAEVELESEDITFSGGIQLYSHQEEAGIHAEFLEWNSENRRLQGRDGERVSIIRDDGSTIYGSGFLADMRHRSLEFRSQVEGAFVDNGTSDDSAAAAEDP
ncbi:LPS export ABC transporter periplasmic protein LptC [Spirochaeta africana]|uniref:LPS export ABC transporter periplasmic protein LptC n=1 Tax=Spirochaeta africana (strain ATCC 700263 / DSM 8902 / Z-7692) TaxID=889378 RepID=H9UMF7_SPIAZ|nr:LPS export ABC transporter periplasmic protein LptC [Spirochaeta africana]AFG38700.1 Protein of unknown function (DUF1239) [Spirochaeta africana DSM 8902]